MKDVRFGILGIGGMGRHHAQYLYGNEIPGAKLVAGRGCRARRARLGANPLRGQRADLQFAHRTHQFPAP